MTKKTDSNKSSGRHISCSCCITNSQNHKIQPNKPTDQQHIKIRKPRPWLFGWHNATRVQWRAARVRRLRVPPTSRRATAGAAWGDGATAWRGVCSAGGRLRRGGDRRRRLGATGRRIEGHGATCVGHVLTHC